MAAKARFRPPAPARGTPRRLSHQTFLGDFTRELARRGFPLDLVAVRDAREAMDIVGAGSREDLYWALHAIFVKRREQSALFRRAFDMIWPA